MQNAQKITDRIIKEAKEAAAAVIEAAKAEAAEKLAAAQAQADEFVKHGQQEAAQAAEEQKRRRLSAVDSELRKEVLAARRSLLDGVFDKALQKLAALKPEEQVAMMAPRIVEAAPDGKGQVFLAKKDAAAFGEKLMNAVNELYAKKGVKPELNIAKENISVTGGFVLKTANIEYNNTYEALIKASKEELERKVAAVLFDAGTGGQN